VVELIQDELGRFAAVLEPDDRIAGRTETADRVLQRLGLRSPPPVLLVGRPGSGRTATLGAIRNFLEASGIEGAERANVVRVDCGRLLDIGGTSLRALREAARAPNVIALDDVDLLFGLGAHTFDTDLAAVVRSMAHDPDVRLIATIASDYVGTFETREPELASTFERIELPPLDEQSLLDVADEQADILQSHHGVSIPDKILELAAGPGPPGGRLSHPGLLVARLDAACVHAKARGSSEVGVGDVDIYHREPVADLVDPDRLGVALRRRVAGQDGAVEAVTTRLALTSRNLDLSAHRPDGIFLFVGPTGVGKTELALALAESRFDDGRRLIRLDMSEYGEDHTVSRIVGSPPGYIGSDSPAGWLTTRVRQEPRAVILLDEIEKAHRAVWMLLLQIFDAGQLTDGRGEVASFADSVIVMTSNLGTGDQAANPIGFASGAGAAAEASRERVMEAVRDAMPPELVNRIDEVVVFEPLDLPVIEEIAQGMVDRAVATLGERGWAVEVEPAVVKHVAGLGYDPQYGARHLKRAVEEHLLGPLATRNPGTYRAVLRDRRIAWEADAVELGDREPVRLRAADDSPKSSTLDRSVVVTACPGPDREAVGRIVVEAVLEDLAIEEVVELLGNLESRALAIGGLAPGEAARLQVRLEGAGAEAEIGVVA
jgi:ATP-dependent Clp protease ATP-binding subunit ClpA